LGVVSVKADAALGVFVVGLAVLMIGVVKEFNVALLVIGGLLMLGSVAATARQRRTGPDPEVTLRPGGKDRPWRRR
jgi:cytochrome c biogenesis protein ResB